MSMRFGHGFVYRTRRRFFSNNGAFVGRHLPNGAISLVQAIRRKVLNSYPELPWIPFSATRVLNQLCRKEWIVHEVGSGLSTMWLAKRVRFVTSIEADEGWYAKLQAFVDKRGIDNVDLRYEWRRHIMSDFSDVPDASLDLLFIDGGPRSECLANGFGKVRSGGYLYLDNTDDTNMWPGLAEFLVEKEPMINRIRRFIDYVPASVQVSEGLLIQRR